MLDKIVVRNFRSLRDFELALRPLNVFVGPNGSGKSNILDALRFLHHLFKNREGIINSWGGIGDILWNGNYGEPLSISLEGHGVPQMKCSHRVKFLYELQVSGRPDQSWFISRERFTAWTEAAGDGLSDPMERQLMKTGRIVLLEYPDSNGDAILRNLEGAVLMKGHFGAGVPNLALFALTPETNWVIGGFKAAVTDWRFFNFSPHRMRRASAVKNSLDPGEEGEDLSTALHALQSQNGDEFRSLDEALRGVIPEVQSVLTMLADREGQTYVALREKGLGVAIKPWMMSDGTLRMLAHLAALSLPSPRAMIGFEEPENYIHPHLAEVLSDSLRKSAQRSQVLVTTQSPYVLNGIDVEDIVVVEKDGGATKASRAAEKQGIKEALELARPGEVWFSGNLGGVP